MNDSSRKASDSSSIPWFGTRKYARELLIEVKQLREHCDDARRQLERLGVLSVVQLEAERQKLQTQVAEISSYLSAERSSAKTELETLRNKIVEAKKQIVETEDTALLQEAGVYNYYHPLSDAVSYQAQLTSIQEQTKEMNRKEGGAILASTTWTVNGSAAQGRAMVRDFSKLMLRAFNAEADTLVRGLKPYKVGAAIERLNKVAETIERLGKTMSIVFHVIT